jgi:hypothetical protein
MQMTIGEIKKIANVIVNTRDFCGDEREAAFEQMAELGIPRRDRALMFVMALGVANVTWRKSQKAADVKFK